MFKPPHWLVKLRDFGGHIEISSRQLFKISHNFEERALSLVITNPTELSSQIAAASALILTNAMTTIATSQLNTNNPIN